MNSIDPRAAAAGCGTWRPSLATAAAWRRRLVWALAACSMGAAAPGFGAAAVAEPQIETQAAGDAAAASPAQVWPESDTVLDLLRADARAAAAQRLGRAQDWLPPSAAAQLSARGPAHGMSGSDAQDNVDVLAIYGVGRVLHADVSVNGAVWRYRQGRHWPLGVAGQADAPRYALVAIDLPCVRLRRQDDVRTACLHTGQVHD